MAFARRRFINTTSSFRDTKNTLAATLAGSIHKDVYYARARGYDSALAAALYPDNVPESVYDNLIAAVRANLPAVHHYYDVRRRKMKLKDIHHYDTYVPILSELSVKHTWKQATKLILQSLKPLGDEYCGALEKGLNGGWSDRYPNQGKQSGAFSCGTYDGDPFILMNYTPEVLGDVFTLAHEAGHSMHSYYSAKHQSFEYYNYTIFVAEVASTFNEQLLSQHLMDRARDEKEAGLSDQSRDRWHSRHDRPTDHVRRVREDRARDGGSRRAAHRASLQRCVYAAVAGLLWTGVRD